MITQEQLSAALHHPVYGRGGQKIGEARHVFFDDATGRPEWVTVKTGLFGGGESFVPIRDAAVAGDHLEVPYTKQKVKTAPTVDVDAAGHLSAQEEHTLYDFYGVDWKAAAREPAGQTAQAGQGPAQPRTSTQQAQQAPAPQMSAPTTATQTAPTPTASPATAPTPAASAQRTPEQWAPERQAQAPGEQFGTATGQQAATGRTDDAMARADAMTLWEEQMHVRVERRETGRVKLRKYVVTEEREQNVPLRHEEARVVSEPITEKNRDQAMSGRDVAEAEPEVILHEETPVVETTAQPKERVHLTVDERTEQKMVRGRVRKERVKLEGAEEDEDRGGMGR